MIGHRQIIKLEILHRQQIIFLEFRSILLAFIYIKKKQKDTNY